MSLQLVENPILEKLEFDLDVKEIFVSTSPSDVLSSYRAEFSMMTPYHGLEALL